MTKATRFIQGKLQQRAGNGTLRSLSSAVFPFDFSSNDYLGFAGSTELKIMTDEKMASMPVYKNGATGSRLLSGNTSFTELTEQRIADFHQAEAGLLFNSGYDANVGLISCLAQRGDTIIADELIHASLIDGARLSYANRYTFKHNDLRALENKLKVAAGNIYVLVESVYSMDGDAAPLTEISKLCRQYDAQLIVDEAHALGIFGDHGAGMVQMLGLQDEIFARVVTFGKALGCHGAIVLGSKLLRDYLINFARPFIYTTAAPIHSIAAIHAAYELLIKTDYSLTIGSRIAFYLSLIQDQRIRTIQSNSAIQTVLFNDGTAAKLAAGKLQDQGFDVKAILSPTVAQGKERLRICLHIFNTEEEMKMLVNQLKTITHE